ncbi:MAG: phenylalanine 4-monooxygenase [Emcibacteraceae bacterium]|nr:phenylalanine 4-monooxygenase [Emcibacteraceae bacterium]
MKPFDFSTLPVLKEGLYINEHVRPEGLGFDWVLPTQRKYTNEEHKRWDFLYDRMMKEVPGRACDEFIDGLEILNLDQGGVPKLSDVSEKLKELTGWTLVPVPALIPDNVHFYHLANKRFPVGDFLRTEEQLDYLDQPDVFHDVFAHAPMLANTSFSRFLQNYGKTGYEAMKHNRLRSLAALYMHTVELGLIKTDKGIRIYGAAILSSHMETKFALEGKSPNRFHMDFERMLRTDYVLSDAQQSYFVIDSFDDLFNQMATFPFTEAYARIEPSYQFAASAILDTDKVYQKGTQEYSLRGGRFSNAVPV